MLLLFSTADLRAQDDLISRFQAGRSAFESARYDEAIQHLTSIIQEQPAFRLEDQSTAAFWLGKTHAAKNEPEQALDVWRSGMQALESEEAFDVLLADAYIKAVFRESAQSDFIRAIIAYLDLLDHAGRSLPPHELSVVLLHVEQMIFLLPDEVRSEVAESSAKHSDGTILRRGAGELLANWWWSEDPLPATLWNERVAEHLDRVATAEERFASSKSLSGLDERGVLFVRLGAPTQVEEIKSDFLNSREALLADAEFAGISGLPEHEFWVYEHLGRYARYLFVKERGAYRLADLDSLLPTSMKSGFSQSERGRLRASLSIQLMHDLLDELAWLDPEYTSSFVLVDGAVWQIKESQNRRVGKQGNSSLYRATLGTTPFTIIMYGQPVLIGIARWMLMHQTKVVERRLARKRRTEVPKISSGFSAALPLPVDLRQARFLDEDGTTRTEFYWAIPAGGLIPSLGIQQQILRKYARLSYQHLIHVSAVQQTPDFRTRKITRDRYGIADGYFDAAAPVHTTIVRADTGLYHIALQWDQYMVHDSGNQDDPNNLSFVKTGMRRADSLLALSPNPETLVMSDLVPLVAETLPETAFVRDEEGFLVPVHVRQTITPQAKLALYFEAYHLLYDNDDQTHYTVSYEVVYVQTKSGLAGLLGKRQEVITAASTRHTGHSRTIREYVSLDLSEWEDADELRITVRLTDETTGNTAERTLEFDLVASRPE